MGVEIRKIVSQVETIYAEGFGKVEKLDYSCSRRRSYQKPICWQISGRLTKLTDIGEELGVTLTEIALNIYRAKLRTTLKALSSVWTASSSTVVLFCILAMRTMRKQSAYPVH